jgi:hypothetical protein
MPDQRSADDAPIETDEGTIRSLIIQARDGPMVFVAGRQIYPAAAGRVDDGEFFKQAASSLTPEGGRVTSERAIRVGSLVARAYEFELRRPEQPDRSGRARIVRDGATGYYLLVSGPVGSFDAEKARQFIESFAPITADTDPEPAPPPPPAEPGPRPGPVPFEVDPERDEVPDVSENAREVPDGWPSFRYQDLEVHLAMPARPSESRETRPTLLGQAERRRLALEHEGLAFAVEMWTFPVESRRLADDDFFPRLAAASVEPGRHEQTLSAGRIRYEGLPGRTVNYRTTRSRDNQTVAIWMRLYRSGATAWVLTITMPTDQIDSGLASEFFNNVRLVGPPIGR